MNHSAPRQNKCTMLTNSPCRANIKEAHKLSLNLSPHVEGSSNNRNSINVQQIKKSHNGNIDSFSLSRNRRGPIIFTDNKIYLQTICSILIIAIIFCAILIFSYVWICTKLKYSHQPNKNTNNIIPKMMSLPVVSVISMEYRDANEYNFHAIGVPIQARWFVATNLLSLHQPYTKCPRKHELYARSGSEFWSTGGKLHKVLSTIQPNTSDSSSLILVLGFVLESFDVFLHLHYISTYQNFNYINASIFGWDFDVDDYDEYSTAKYIPEKNLYFQTESSRNIFFRNNLLEVNLCQKSIGLVLVVDHLIVGVQLEPTCYRSTDSVLFAYLPHYVPWIELNIYV